MSDTKTHIYHSFKFAPGPGRIGVEVARWTIKAMVGGRYICHEPTCLIAGSPSNEPNAIYTQVPLHSNLGSITFDLESCVERTIGNCRLSPEQEQALREIEE